MAEDFYTDDWGYDDAGYYYDGGGGGDYYGSGSDDFYYGYGAGESTPIDYAPGFESGQYSGDDFWSQTFTDYLSQGFSPDDAAYFADTTLESVAASGDIIRIAQSAPELIEPQLLPDIQPYYGLPYVPDYNYWQSPPYIPSFPEYPLPPPPLPPSPASSQPNLPPACPGGQYHPYPIGHPQQNLCVPFPAMPTPAPLPPQRPSQTSTPLPQAPRPPQQPQQQQGCPTGYYRSPNGQCSPIPRCTTPGTVFDQSRGICVPRSQAVSPLPIPSEAQDLWANLKELPWWLWVALGGLLLLSKDDDGRKTTVVHRRAS